MCFSGENFPDDVSFACRVLVGVSFSNVSLNERAGLQGWSFRRGSVLQEFEDSEVHAFRRCPVPAKDHLRRSSFQRLRKMPHCRIRTNLRLRRVRDVRQFTFLQLLKLLRRVPHRRYPLRGCRILAGGNVHRYPLPGRCKLQQCRNSGTRHPSQRASYGRPLKFFESEIHEGVDFGEANWTGAEDLPQSLAVPE